MPILSRFFLVTTQSGVKSMTLSLDGARERLVASHHAIIECVAAVWTYKYASGYTVMLRGPLTAHIIVTPSANGQLSLKFEHLQFDATHHDKFIALDAVMGQRVTNPRTPRIGAAPTPSPNGTSTVMNGDVDKNWDEPRILIEHGSIPGEPVNAFGIPQATMRCLELAESVGAMRDLINFSKDSSLGPIEALKRYAGRIRENSQVMASLGMNGGPPGSGGFMANGMNGVSPSPAITLHQGLSSPSSLGPSHLGPSKSPSMAIDQKPPIPLNNINAPPPPPSSTNPPSAGTPAQQQGVNTTPSMSHATLKRKQDTGSPSGSSGEPASKRLTRRRRPGGG